jgi:hypothetical protein
VGKEAVKRMRRTYLSKKRKATQAHLFKLLCAISSELLQTSNMYITLTIFSNVQTMPFVKEVLTAPPINLEKTGQNFDGPTAAANSLWSATAIL